MEAFLGFDFYGSGNVGDDLMLAGFLNLCSEFDFTFNCVVPRSVSLLSQRFPEVNWLQDSEYDREEVLSESDMWVGVGDTPFSDRQSSWLLDYVVDQVDLCKRHGNPMYMIGVGAEKELLTSIHRPKASKIIESVKRIVTRDRISLRILEKVWNNHSYLDKIVQGVDLANFYLVNSCLDGMIDRGKIGICYWDEDYNSEQRLFLKDLLNILRERGYDVEFFANETRPQYERRIYRDLVGFWGWLGIHTKSSFYCPGYVSSSTINELISHYKRYDVVVASRYHALLTAAWMGKRCVGIDNRSKTAALAASLGITAISVPCDVEVAINTIEQSQVINRSELTRLISKGKVVKDLLDQMYEGNA
jgi:polysaccharide pyruvyl transferase WcaK-like protein